jgi:hypothetical protein
VILVGPLLGEEWPLFRVHRFVALSADEDLPNNGVGLGGVDIPSPPTFALRPSVSGQSDEGCATKDVTGNPDPKHISTSFVERQNWTVRTNMRRYTRLSNGFSRKLENHADAVALNYFAYNFIKIHRTLRMSPAMAAGVTDRLWDVADLVALWESYEQRRAERVA